MNDPSKFKSPGFRLALLSECFLCFGPDPVSNIQSLVEMAGAVFGAALALYNRLEGDNFHAVGKWHAPEGFKEYFSTEGTICRNVIDCKQPSLTIIRNLQQSKYASVPLIKGFGFSTYAGHPVKNDSSFCGVLCMFFTADIDFSENDDSFLSILAQAIGVEERRYIANQTIQQGTDAWQSTFDAITDLISLQTPDFKLLKVNRAYAEALGVNPEELQGKHCYEIIHKLESPHGICPQAMVLEDRRPHTSEYFEENLKKYIEVTTLPILNKKETVEYIVHIVKDISARKRDEELLKSAHRETEEMNSALISALQAEKKMHAELEIARQEADDANRAKSGFIATMSHEIRTPMNGIIGFTALLMNANIAPEHKKYVEYIHHSSDALLGIVNDILDFSKIEAGKMEIEHVDFDLRTTVSNVNEILSHKAHEKGIRIETIFNHDVPHLVKGDPGRIRQIVTNFLSNAIKFTDSGSITIRVEVLDTKDNAAEGMDTGCSVKCSVTDTGMGISPENQGKLFKAFSQVDVSTARQFGGTGLGLVISKQLVALMKGAIGFESLPGKGSTFWFAVPFGSPRFERTSQTGHPGPKSDPNVVPAHCSILLAEDNDLNQKIALAMLDKYNFIIDIANNGKEAVSTFNASPEKYDCILMDCQMPEMDGYTATAKIREFEQTRNSNSINEIKILRVPIIALSASVLSEDRKRCFDSGMDDFVSKPVEARTLIEAIAKWVKSKHPHVPVQLPVENLALTHGQLPDLSEIAHCLGLEISQVKRLLLELLDSFPARLEVIASAAKDGDTKKLHVSSHSLKGALLNFKLSAFAQLAGVIEKNARDGLVADAIEIIDVMRKNYHDLNNVFRAQCKIETPKEEIDIPAVSQKLSPAMVAKIFGAYAIADFEAISLIAHSIQNMDNDILKNFGARLQRLAETCNDLEIHKLISKLKH